MGEVPIIMKQSTAICISVDTLAFYFPDNITKATFEEAVKNMAGIFGETVT